MSGDRGDRVLHACGFLLIAGYVAQARLDVAWPWLAELQQDDTYKVASGSFLALLLGVQWLLGARRMYDPSGAVFRHKLLGMLAPVVLYAHASRFAYGYLGLLTATFLATIACGLIGRPVIRTRARWLFTTWFILHIATSAVLVVLAGYHAVIALAYE